MDYESPVQRRARRELRFRQELHAAIERRRQRERARAWKFTMIGIVMAALVLILLTGCAPYARPASPPRPVECGIPVCTGNATRIPRAQHRMCRCTGATS